LPQRTVARPRTDREALDIYQSDIIMTSDILWRSRHARASDS
jgi:hypothetical protein